MLNEPLAKAGVERFYLRIAGCVVAVGLLLYGSILGFHYLTRDIGRSNSETAIRNVLTSQEAAWNAGDLDGFMAGYWKSDKLKFLSGDTVTTGWQATHDRFQKQYKAEGQEMGKLKFDILDVDVVSSDAAIVRGKWALAMSDGKNPHGLFTLLFRDIDGKWVIVSDHTSAADK